jgi:hypothetical protein
MGLVLSLAASVPWHVNGLVDIQLDLQMCFTRDNSGFYSCCPSAIGIEIHFHGSVRQLNLLKTCATEQTECYFHHTSTLSEAT